jgi:3-deoxy-D-manno-octulosonate 8-phosphate phosphatase (KDO 8-P phosphatase)
MHAPTAGALPNLEVDHPRIAPDLARRIRMVGLDVDGVLTDGGVYLGATKSAESGVPFELKRYDIQDGLGIQLLRDCGLTVVIITGRVSDSVAQRAAELRVDAVVQDPEAQKLSALIRLASDFGCTMDEVAFVGDDLPDLAVMRQVGLPVAVGNAVPEVRRAARLQLRTDGGHGAVREFAESLLEARGEWIDAVERYVAHRSLAVRSAVTEPEDTQP